MPETERTIYYKTREDEVLDITTSMEDAIDRFTEERIKPVLREQARRLDAEGLFPTERLNQWTEFEGNVKFRGIEQKLLWISESHHEDTLPYCRVYLTPKGDIVEIPIYIITEDGKASVSDPISEIRPLSPSYYSFYVIEALENIKGKITTARCNTI